MSKYPLIEKGLGKFTPNLWARIMGMLKWFEDQNIDEHTIKGLELRLQHLETNRDWFFAKLLRAHVLDHDLYNPNVYEYAWVEVNPWSCSGGPLVECPDCTALCIPSRHGILYDYDSCCDLYNDYVKHQGHFSWYENPSNSSWGNTLYNSDNNDGSGMFNTDTLQSDYNPLQYPCIAGNGCALNCNPNASGTVGQPNYPNINTIAYTRPAINILESFNTGLQAAGVDQRYGIGDFMMQAVGGGDTQRSETLGSDGSYDGTAAGIPECHTHEDCLDNPPCTQYEFPLKTTPIVRMFNIIETDGTVRQVFEAVNSYDGTCVTC